MKNILIIQGGGRPKGNTAQLVAGFEKGATDAGHRVEAISLINYIGFHDKGMLLAGGCGDTNGKPQIEQTPHLKRVYEFGKEIYS